MLDQLLNSGTSLKGWVDKNVNKRWQFTPEQVKLIYELVKFFESFDNKLDEALELYSEEISENLNVLYHGTKRASLNNILMHGLDPSKSVYADDEEKNDWGDFGPPYHFIYLSKNPKCARTFAPGGEINIDKDQQHGIVLEIRLPLSLQRKLVLDRGEFIRAPFVIPPKYIRVYSDL